MHICSNKRQEKENHEVIVVWSAGKRIYITKLKKAAIEASTRLDAIDKLDAELKTGDALGEALRLALRLAYGYPLEVTHVADAGAGTLPVCAGEAPLGPAGTRPIVGTAPALVPVFVTKLTCGTVTV